MLRRHRPSAATALVLAATLGLAACGGSGSSDNGVASKSPAAVVAAAKQAAGAASSVHLSGSIAAAGAPTTFDLRLVKGKGGAGTLSVGGSSFDLIRVGSTIYVKGSPSFYRQFKPAAAQLLQGKWLRGQANSGAFAKIGPFTDLTTFVDQALTLQSTTRANKGATATVAGQKVIQITDGPNGTLSVATTGKPYPVQISTSGTSGGAITFTGWNASVPLAAPADSVDIASLPAGK